MSEITEAVARAICLDQGCTADALVVAGQPMSILGWPFTTLTHGHEAAPLWKFISKTADAAIAAHKAALAEAGYVIVPREPTEAMMSAADKVGGDDQMEALRQYWRAMIDAAPKD